MWRTSAGLQTSRRAALLGWMQKSRRCEKVEKNKISLNAREAAHCLFKYQRPEETQERSHEKYELLA
ncbi:hypothetical protein AMECASPLE_017742 [Ameca splendens]|uniref:Uncharacterized protein n=1 Tax=Ameca splendens TaxID=208324 RepID=A0ABV0XRE8_9TELE